jgi:hypothetical protein
MAIEGNLIKFFILYLFFIKKNPVLKKLKIIINFEFIGVFFVLLRNI